MPYFDDRTYEVDWHITNHDLQTLRRFAAEFCVDMEKDGALYPEQVKSAVWDAIAMKNFNEIAMLADGTSDYAIHVEKLFRSEYSKIKKEKKDTAKEESFRLICIGAAILCRLKWNYSLHEGSARLVPIKGLESELQDSINDFNRNWGLGEISFIESFLKVFVFWKRGQTEREWKRHQEQMQRAVERRRVKEERRKEEDENRQERIRRRKEYAERREQRKKEREDVLLEFRQLDLNKQLERIITDENHLPSYYEFDYDSLQNDELKKLPVDLLERIANSFVRYPDKAWRAFRRRVIGFLSEEK